MANDKIEKLDIHPLIKAQEAKGEPTVEFRGFIGTGDKETLRLYAELSMSSYVDIPEEGLVHVEQDPSERGKIRVFVRADQRVREVNRRTVTAQASAFSATVFPTMDDRFPKPELGGLIGCYNRCEQYLLAKQEIFCKREMASFRYVINMVLEVLNANKLMPRQWDLNKELWVFYPSALNNVESTILRGSRVFTLL